MVGLIHTYSEGYAMFEQFRNGYYYHVPRGSDNRDGDFHLKFEWRLMYNIYVENNLRRQKTTFIYVENNLKKTYILPHTVFH